MPHSWDALGLCWTVSARRKLPRNRRVDSCLVLHQHINTYRDGCSASEARQTVGAGRGAVVRGTNLAEAIHRLALWVGGLSTAGAVCTLRPGISAHAGYRAGLQLPRPEQLLEEYG